jgi:hypothetical protein
MGTERLIWARTGHGFLGWSPDRMLPFSAYLAEISASGRVLANRALAATSMDVLTRSMQRLFEKSPRNGDGDGTAAAP